MEVKEYDQTPSDMVTLTVPAQKYAAIRHKGTNLKTVESYNELNRWIEANDYERLKDKWHLERFYSWINPENIDVELLDTII
ncbi:GyrI-like domain-containing protein [Ornithinibacillus bavariensis]|uniref:GyrI-like small molecule binding domain-containing protein n=1 Tax=Ornithinibacillus bavariensis TaxID=545502 RepID=A0A919X9L3_9BACI|nr:GyrI-like domain-containing protein [Ornithinibacillus bavariensis]GIO28566.1 hypothetical protein J43TS3_31770 [Ornithinibacillus bavariensis]